MTFVWSDARDLKKLPAAAGQEARTCRISARGAAEFVADRQLKLAGGGFLLNATGFDVALGGNQSAQTITLMRLFDAFLPFVASGVAIWAIAAYPITEQAAHATRQKLEARRGSGAAPASAAG